MSRPAEPCGSPGEEPLVCGDRGGRGCPGPPKLSEENLRKRSCLFVFCILGVCYCTMLTFFFCVLLLIPPAIGVCQVCFGEAACVGCTGDMASCPWVKGISDNASVVTAIVTGTVTTSVLSIGKLLPQRFRKLFPRSILDLIATIYRKPKNGVEYDPSGKNLTDLMSAVKSGCISKSEVLLYITRQMDALEETDPLYETKFKRFHLHFTTIKDLTGGLASNDGTQSVEMYVLAKLSGLLCRDRDMAVVLDSEGYNEGEAGPSSSSSSSPSSSATCQPEPQRASLSCECQPPGVTAASLTPHSHLALHSLPPLPILCTKLSSEPFFLRSRRRSTREQHILRLRGVARTSPYTGGPGC